MDSDDLVRRQALTSCSPSRDPPTCTAAWYAGWKGNPTGMRNFPSAAKFVQARLLEIRERAPLQDEQATA